MGGSQEVDEARIYSATGDQKQNLNKFYLNLNKTTMTQHVSFDYILLGHGKINQPKIVL